MVSSKTTIRIRYADTDQMKYVYNGKYLEFFEVGRTELIRDLGMSYKSFEEAGYMLPLYDAYVKYHSPAFYDEVIEIESTLNQKPMARLRIDYTIRVGDRVIATGYTQHAFISAETGKPTRSPEIFNKLIDKYFKE
ncbi:MAG: acyl-CoA thioesterase [Ignavibacteriales bacterium]|nr:MAG: acyl-CoA thioesterase [Ignavibacteriaceae bacterium]MBW7873945.1 acyl-CoA thioesterase [Ignavibacteria bacterium]MCZ2143296.1 acyl-CoA thioesterase [Ignavibacteriales bacterium]OQY76041.1 MAG: thioesterase [Ignavibacteriales bacterium UTCHB3]MBV6444178.1 putative esterase [Ignavibacteriaceae bacterium]